MQGASKRGSEAYPHVRRASERVATKQNWPAVVLQEALI